MILGRICAFMAVIAVAGCFGTRTEFTVDGNLLILEGALDGETLAAFEAALDAAPGIDTLVLRHIEGSLDDEANLVFSQRVRELGLTTVVPSDGMVASGGTDLFLAGASRRLEPGACVGVHSWATDTYDAQDLSRDHAEHDPYLDFYENIGIDPDFYWFTIYAAGADDMHWMSAEEAQEWDMTTGGARAPQLGGAAVCETR